MRPIALLSSAAFAFFLAGCGGGDGSPPGPVGPEPVATVTLSVATAQLDVGETLQITVTLRDAAGNVLTGRTVTWSSSDVAVASVDQTGLVTGVGAGVATITATSEGQNGTAEFTIILPSFAPTADQTLSGARVFESFSIPAGVTVTADASLSVTVEGALTISGTLAADCVDVSVSAASVEVTGTVENACASPGASPPGLSLTSDGPMTVSAALVQSSGDIVLKTDPELNETNFATATPDDGKSLTITNATISHSPAAAPTGAAGGDGTDGSDLTLLVAGNLVASTADLRVQGGGAGGAAASGGTQGVTGGDGGAGGALRVLVVGNLTGTPPAGSKGLTGSASRLGGSVLILDGGLGGDGAPAVDLANANDPNDPDDQDAFAFAGHGGLAVLPRLDVRGTADLSGVLFMIQLPGRGGAATAHAADGLGSTAEGGLPGAGGNATARGGASGSFAPDCYVRLGGDCAVSSDGPLPDPSGSFDVRFDIDPNVPPGGPPIPADFFAPGGDPFDGSPVEIVVGRGGDMLHTGGSGAGPGGSGSVDVGLGSPSITIRSGPGDDRILVPPGNPGDVLIGGGLGGDALLDGCPVNPPVDGFDGGPGGTVVIRRSQDPDVPDPFVDQVDVEIVALSLVSVDPIIVPGGGVPLSGGAGGNGLVPGAGGMPGTVNIQAPFNVDSFFDVWTEINTPPGWGPPPAGPPGLPCTPGGPFTTIFELPDDPSTGIVPDGTYNLPLDGPGGPVGTVPFSTMGVLSSDNNDVGFPSGASAVFNFPDATTPSGTPFGPNFQSLTVCPLFGTVDPSNPFRIEIVPINDPPIVVEHTTFPDNFGVPRDQMSCFGPFEVPGGIGSATFSLPPGGSGFVSLDHVETTAFVPVPSPQR